jgi:hypothetical protein
MSMQKRWNSEEEKVLVENYAIMGARWCAEKLGRGLQSVMIKANRLGIKRDGDFRYDRPEAPDGYVACWNCKEILPEGQFYSKNKDGSYGKKTNLCRACNQEAARRYYKNNKEKYERIRKDNPIKVLLKNIKARAKKNNIPFDLNEDDLFLPDTCPVLGIKIIPFDNSGNSPSVDRFIPELGYVRGNCQIISKRANKIKNNATIEEIEKLYLWMRDYLS